MKMQNAFKGYNDAIRAIVIRVNDPQNLGRVQIYIPNLHGKYQQEAVINNLYPWAYSTNIDLTNTEIIKPGTLVWVVFNGGDIRFPLIIGTFNNGPMYQITGNFQLEISAYTQNMSTAMKSPFILKESGGYTFRLTSPQGPRSDGEHGGVDLVCDGNKTIVACEDATIKWIQKWNGTTRSGTSSQTYGNLIVLQLSNEDLLYHAHLSDGLYLSGMIPGQVDYSHAGEEIKKGQSIGIMGNTGASYGNHLHWELRDKNKNRKQIAAWAGFPNAKGTYNPNPITK